MNSFPCIIQRQEPFPFPYDSDEHGLVAVGGGLGVERLLAAYSIGLFPWFEEQGHPFWFSPDPRCILYPADIKISKSMRALIRREAFYITVNQAFNEVITACAETPRPEQDATWISGAFIRAYCDLYQAGFAHSVEVWNTAHELVGGLYGVRIGEVFFGESMFSRESNASKYGFIQYVKQLSNEGVKLIDCQQSTQHLLSLGAINIARKDFLNLLSIHTH